MKKLNVRKTIFMFSIATVATVTTIGFQNFARYEPFKKNDTSDLFLGGGLTMALKAAQKEAPSSKVALNTDHHEDNSKNKNRSPANLQNNKDLKSGVEENPESEGNGSK
jgi:hypothetical protein